MKKSAGLAYLDKMLRSPYVTACVIGVMVAFLLFNQVFWGVFSGVRLWGDYVNQFIGLSSLLDISPELDRPLHHRISLINISLFLGALVAALLSREFGLQGVNKMNLAQGAVGGSFMGAGATLAGGCTIGGTYTPIALSAPTGFVMLLGLFLGALVAYQCLMWLLFNMPRAKAAKPARLLSAQYERYLAIFILLSVLLWCGYWYFSGQSSLSHRAMLILCGLSLGSLMQRSRFCLSNAIRSPLLGGSLVMTKAVMLLFLIGVLLNGLVINLFDIDIDTAIPPTFWIGSFLGGMLFGFGMIFAGGCASGSLWRMGEGGAKSFITIFFMGWSGSIFTAIGRNTGLLQRTVTPDWREQTVLGEQFYLNHSLAGYVYAISLTVLIIAVWYFLIKLWQKKQWFL